jgi:hypothetical protein
MGKVEMSKKRVISDVLRFEEVLWWNLRVCGTLRCLHLFSEDL